MKYFLVSLMPVFFHMTIIAQSIPDESSYLTGMKMIDAAQSENQFLEAAAFFEKITARNEGQWLSYYYAGLAYTMASHVIPGPGSKDSLIDLAQHEVDKAFKLNPEETELLILQSFVFQARIQVNPLARGLNYSSKAGSILQKVMEKDPGNPRAHLLLAYNTYHTPEIFGGGPVNALPMFVEARNKFKAYNPDSDIHPRWGAEEASDMISKCEQEITAR
ncbi:MAG: hypothetical protein JXB19_02270 [Bacteroidales bacterium]|nr:hypothetical protein [Bacteroidales bacterium]